MKFSIMTEPHLGGTYDQLLAAALLAEREDLVSFARCDHYLSGREPRPDAMDAFANLAGLARDTEKVRLTVLVTPLTFRHPAVIVKNAVTIDQMSGGRFDLGVGTGWMDLEHEAFGIPFYDVAERFARLEDGIGYLKAAFGEGHSRYEGEYFSLDADVQPKPTGLRMIIGGGGDRRTPSLAGLWADEYNCFLSPPEVVGARIGVMREAAGERAVETTVMGHALVGATDSEYREKLARTAARLDSTPEDLEERWTKAGLILGTPGQAAEVVAALEAVGVERIYIQWLDLADYDGLASTLDIVRG